MADDTDSATYPLPQPDADSRFTLGLIVDVAEVLTAHSYPPIRSGLDYVALREALFTFLYATDTADLPADTTTGHTLTGEEC